MTDSITLSPKEWIEYQRHLRGYEELPLPKDLVTKATKTLPGEHSGLIEQFSQLTRGQLDDRLIQVYLDSVKGVLTAREREAISGVYFGIFPTFEINGFADRTPRGDPIVMIHLGMPLCAHLWANFFLYTLEQGSWDFLDRRPNDVVGLFCLIGSLWEKDLWKKKMKIISDAHSIFPRDEESWLLSSVLTHSAMVFVLGHEVGHIIEGHKGYNPNDPAYNHHMEYSADTWALRICLRYVILSGIAYPDTYYSKFMLLGPYLVLSMTATIMDVQGKTHPSPSERLMKIRNAYEPTIVSILGNEGFQRYKQEMDADFLDRITSIGERLFERHKAFAHIINDMVEAQGSAPETN
jgi:hypothetical protein